MKCILMNKNKEVLLAEYNSASKFFDKIYEIKNIKYAPLIVEKAYKKETEDNFKVILSNWFKSRGIPSWRDKLDILLSRLNIKTQEELLDKAFGLSLSDQYWIKPININLNYDNINFFDNHFDSTSFLEASFSNSDYINITQSSLKTPNNTTDGMLKKTWVIENDKRYLLKGGFKNEIIEPFNEVLASMICERLNFDHVPYTIDIVKNKIVSKCPCFINNNTELISAYQIMYDLPKYQNKNDYYEYVKTLEKKGIENAREKVENMFILDYIIMNEDRHLNNFGIIRDVNTLKWLDVSPIFDNGESLKIISYDDEIEVSGEGRFFYTIEKFDKIIDLVENLKRIDLNKLNGVVEEYDTLLHKYQKITGISDKRIHSLCVLLNNRINSLKEKIDNKN